MTSISLDIDYINGYINGESYAKRQYSKEYNQNSDFPSRKYALRFPAFEMHSKTTIHPRNHWMFVLKLTSNNISALVQIKACADQATSHCLNKRWLDYWRIYPSLGLNELTSRSTQNDAQLPKYFKYCFGWYLKWVRLLMCVQGRWWYMPDCTFMNTTYWIKSELSMF